MEESIMAKIKVTLEMEIDEKELKGMKSSQNGYDALTKQEYLDGMKFKIEDGEVIFTNEIEQYYNIYEGDSKCIKNASVTSINLVEE
jgi:hypothetical protein